MTSTLTDHELDALLSGAATRLTATTATIPARRPPPPSLPVGRVATVAAASLLVATAGVVLIATNAHRSERLPAGIDPGAREITIERVIEDADTTTYIASPAGGSLTIKRGAAAAGVVNAGFLIFDGRDVRDACWLPSPGQAECGADDPGFGSMFTRREPGGHFVLTHLPEGAAVQLVADNVKYWARAVDGVVLLPYTDEVLGWARLYAFAADGSQLWTELRYPGENGEVRWRDAGAGSVSVIGVDAVNAVNAGS